MFAGQLLKRTYSMVLVSTRLLREITVPYSVTDFYYIFITLDLLVHLQIIKHSGIPYLFTVRTKKK